ncbi:hypothetical protein SDC9_186633 [bioreactor metagenome]|uniref:GIY-YIG domain-containing protein n=1 Tax=bioreactor metagenome TaxID=1076179 RepID=A0A645HJF6_9ZZZZ|nr:GIY-YIG nuclease family protein [Paludibacter sp.]
MQTKKEIKEAYKSLRFRAGIFQIKNTLHERIYLQTTTDLDRAFNADLFKLNAGMHPNKLLQKDWNELGASNFEMTSYDELAVKDTLSPAEIQQELRALLEMHISELKNTEKLVY